MASTNIIDSVNSQLNRRHIEDASPDMAALLSAIPESADYRSISGGLPTDYSCDSSFGPLVSTIFF